MNITNTDHITVADVSISLHSPCLVDSFRHRIDHGVVIVEDAYSKAEMDAVRNEILALEAMATPEGGAFVYRAGQLWAIWNLYELSPTLMRLALLPDVFRLVPEALGEPGELCRATLMKKVPGAEQVVKWHQDLAIAVDRDLGDADSRGLRENVPHRWVSTELLNQMVIARINVDPQYADGGCLQVIPGSHRWGRIPAEECRRRAEQATPLLCPAPEGSVLFYRPLLAHASGPNTRSDTLHQRRVLHNEFRGVSARPEPPLSWYPWTQSARVTTDGIMFRPRRQTAAEDAAAPRRSGRHRSSAIEPSCDECGECRHTAPAGS